jgi:hypothetical protein
LSDNLEALLIIPIKLASFDSAATNTSGNLSGLGNLTLDLNIKFMTKMENKHWIAISIKHF